MTVKIKFFSKLFVIISHQTDYNYFQILVYRVLWTPRTKIYCIRHRDKIWMTIVGGHHPGSLDKIVWEHEEWEVHNPLVTKFICVSGTLEEPFKIVPGRLPSRNGRKQGFEGQKFEVLPIRLTVPSVWYPTRTSTIPYPRPSL